MSGITRKLVQHFFKFRFYNELSRFKVLCEHVTFGTFCSLLAYFLFKLRFYFSIEIIIQNYKFIIQMENFVFQTDERPLKSQFSSQASLI